MPSARRRSPSSLKPARSPGMGPVRFSGTDKVDTVWLQRRVPFSEGEPYDPTKVEALRGKLTSLGVFNAVRIKPATTLDANGELPIDVELTDRPPRSIGFGVAYETQLGFAVTGFWTHRNLFGQAESLRLTAELTQIGEGYAIRDTGFAFHAAFRKPDWWLGGGCARRGGRTTRGARRLHAQCRDGLCRLRPHLLATLAGAHRPRRRAVAHHPQRHHHGLPAGRPADGDPLQPCQQRPQPDRGLSRRPRRHTVGLQPRLLHRHPPDRPPLLRLRRARPQRGRDARLARHRACGQHRRYPARQAVLRGRRRLGARLRLSICRAARRLQQSAGRRQPLRGQRRVIRVPYTEIDAISEACH